jgi:hypothetical protein
MPKKIFPILICFLALTQVCLYPSPALPSPVNAASAWSDFCQEVPTRREFRLASHERKIIDIEIPGAGVLSVKAEWQGAAKTLALILNGPGQTQAFSREDGTSPLTLTFKISEEMLKSGNKWKISLVNFSRTGLAEGEITWSFSSEQPPRTGLIRPQRAQEKPSAKPSTSKASEKVEPSASTARKSLSIKYFEIQEARGYSEEELDQIRADLLSQKRQLLKARLEQRIEKLFSENRLAPIILPLVLQELEEMSSRRAVFRNVDLSPHLREISDTLKTINEEKGSKYFGQKYAIQSLRSKSGRLQLGKEIIAALDPNFQQKIRETVRQSLSNRDPKFLWQKRQAMNMVTEPLSLRSKQAPRTAISANDKNQLTAAMNSLARSTSTEVQAELLDKLKSLVRESDFLSNLDVHVQEKFNPKDFERFIPDLNSVHNATDYYEYKVDFDHFTCVNKNERSNDEVYFITQTILPRFDPQDIEEASELGKGKLYNVNTRATRTYGGISRGETVGFLQGEKLLFWQNLYNATANFTIDLYEEDYSKSQVVAGYRDAAAQLRQAIYDEVKAAVIDAIKDTVLAALNEALPGQLVSLIDLILSGQFDESTFDRIQSELGGIQTDFIILSMLFSGKSFMDVINFLSAGSPELYLVILSVEVCGPVLIDFFQGEWTEGLKALLCLPLSIFESIYHIFTNLDDFLGNLLAALDPDDHIQTRRVTIAEPHASLGADANWQQTDMPPGGGSGHDSGSHSQKQLRSAPVNIQPELWFFGSSAFYKLYYNVSRTLYGGKEVFGYTLNPEKGVYVVEKKYRVKSPYVGDKIRVKISAMDTLDVPIVYLSGLGGANGNLHGEREFEVEGYHDSEYTLTITSFGKKPIYGFISLEENNDAQPERTDSGGSANYSGGSGSDNKRVQK